MAVKIKSPISASWEENSDIQLGRVAIRIGGVDFLTKPGVTHLAFNHIYDSMVGYSKRLVPGVTCIFMYFRDTHFAVYYKLIANSSEK